MGFDPQDFECFAVEDVVIVDDHSEPTNLQDRPKYQGEELIEVNLVEEGKEAQLIFQAVACLQ